MKGGEKRQNPRVSSPKSVLIKRPQSIQLRTIYGKFYIYEYLKFTGFSVR